MKTTKRLLGLLLAIVMVVGMLPLSVFAEVEVTETLNSVPQIGSKGDLVGIPDEVTPTYLSELYNTEAKKYSYVVNKDGVACDFSLDQNFSGTNVYPFTSTSKRFEVRKGKSNLDADGSGYRTLENGVRVHYSDIVLGRNTTIFEKGLSFYPSAIDASEHATVIFDVSNLNADYFYAVAGMTGEANAATYSDGNKNARKVHFEFYGSKDAVYSENMTFEKLAYCNNIRAYLIGEFNVPITGYNYIKLVATSGGVSNENAESVWADAAVYSVHDWNSEITTPATCLEEGLATYTCANADCGETYTKVIPATGHSYESVVVDPTCTAVGSKTQTCSACGDVITEEIPTTSHSYGEYVDNGDGTQTAICGTCGAPDTREKPFEYWTPDENATNFAWLGDAEKAPVSASGNYSAGNPTDVKFGETVVLLDGSASLVDDEWIGGSSFANSLNMHPQNQNLAAYTEFDLTGLGVDTFYSAMGLTNATEPDKVSGAMFTVKVKLEGEEEYIDLFNSETVYRGTYNEITLSIPANAVALRLEVATVGYHQRVNSAWANACVFKAHNFEATATVPATCTENGKIIYTCADENCGETYDVVIPAAGHSYESVVVDPTCTEAGSSTNTCSACDDVISEEIPATGHSFTNYVAVEGANYELAECDNGCGQTRQKFLPYEDVVVEDIASSITYLSDLYNTDAKLEHFVDPEQGTDWAVDENFDDYLYVYVAEGERYVIPAPNSTEDTRELNNGVTYHRDNIALGVNGTIYEKGLSVRPSDVKLTEQAYVTYDISGLNADRFYAVVGMVGEGNNPKYTDRAVDFELWAKVNAEDEFVKLYSVDGIRISNTGVFNVDISGYNYIKLVAATAGTDDSGTAVSWGNACVYKLGESSECQHKWDDGVETTPATCSAAGKMTYACTNEGCSATQTVSIMPTGEHSYENGKCTVCDAADPSYTGSITLATATLNLQDKVCTIYEATDDQIATNNANVKERGVLLYDSAEKAAEKKLADAYERIVLEENGTVEDKVAYVGQSEGIDARDMDKTQYAVAYVMLTDGTYIYGTKEGKDQIVEFSPLIYCTTVKNDGAADAKVKNLCYAMMHYGAAAQKAQYGKTEGLMNEGFELKDIAYDESMLGNTVFSANTRTINGMKLRSVTMALKGAISYIVKFSVDDSLSEEKLYAEYTLLGETGSVELTYDEGSKLWLATISGIAPKDLGETLTVKPYYLDENEKEVYGGELVFSGYEYTRIVTKNTNYDEKIKDLAKALAMYVYYANVYGNP